MRAPARPDNATSRTLIVSADDFGLSLEVNEAIERAHRDGILRAASLMVGAPQTADAISRAQRLPDLRVGLHLVLVNGKPVLPPDRVPALVDADGNFPTDLGRAGVRYFFFADARRQLEEEIRAQFEAFARTGLPLDHVNAQNHMHVHPTILSLIIKVGPQYGMRSVRIPREPFFASWEATHDDLWPRFANAFFLWPWLSLMQARLKRAGLTTNDYVFGMNDSGRMTSTRVLALLAHLPRGISEMYFHPASGPWAQIDPAIEGYDFAGELGALTSPEVAARLEEEGLVPMAFSDVTQRHAA
ncbi:MAG: hopanoid biosynthesis-associated protein HpnK [Candidatus Eremiobacteraeota bacterium]|nr:hopanoid biosynthesis-associated protein HpnK [Candidatus Eremiobacteraeota bacterium]